MVAFIGPGSIACRADPEPENLMPTPMRKVALFTAAFMALALPAANVAASQADTKFEALSARYVDEFGRFSPVSATALGDHRYDSDLDDVGAAGRAAALEWNKVLLEDLGGIDRASLKRENQVDAAVLENQLRYSIWTEQKYRDWSWDPVAYAQLAGQSLYGLLARDYAPLPERLRAVTARLEKLPRLFEQERANLVPARVPAIHAETAIKQNPGVLSLVDELVVPEIGKMPEAEQARLKAAIETARAAVAGAAEVAGNRTAAKCEGRFPHRQGPVR